MRHAHIALAATIAGLMVSPTPSNAAPGATLTSPAADDGLVQKVQIFPRRYYRQYPYGAPPAVVVPHVVPVVPPAVAGEPVIVVPPPRRQAVENIATGTAKTASTPATTGLTSDRGRNRSRITPASARA